MKTKREEVMLYKGSRKRELQKIWGGSALMLVSSE